MTNQKRLGFLLAVLGFAAVSGCGARTEAPAVLGELRGKVTLDEAPFTVGRLKAVGEDGQSSEVGTVQSTGEYVVPKVPLGKVTLYFLRPVGPAAKGMPFKKDSPDAPKKTTPKKLELYKEELAKVPEKYFNAAESDLSTTVSAGPNAYDIKMTSR